MGDFKKIVCVLLGILVNITLRTIGNNWYNYFAYSGDYYGN